MAISNGYCTLVEVKARLAITDTNDDGPLEAVVEAASRKIDLATGRRFWKDAAADQARYYTAERGDELCIDDLATFTSLATDVSGDRTYTDTWATTDYDLLPYDQILGGHSWPYTRIEVTPRGQKSFPASLRKGVKIVGAWGWPAVPDAINEACLILSARLFKRKDAPFGMAGGERTRTRLPKVDPDVAALVQPFARIV